MPRFDSPSRLPASRPPCMHGFVDKAFDDESTKKAESNVAKDPAKAADPKMTFRDRGVEKRTNKQTDQETDGQRDSAREKRDRDTKRQSDRERMSLRDGVDRRSRQAE